MTQLTKLISDYENMPHGTQRLNGIKKAITQADTEKNTKAGFSLRYEYIRESVFHDDEYKAIIMFPEFLAMYDKNEQLHSEFSHDMMMAFKYIIEDVKDYYQVSRSQCEKYYEEYRKRCERFGYNLRTYYLKKMCMSIYFSEELTRKYLQEYRKCKRDRQSDCMACELSAELQIELYLGEHDKAIETAKPVLEQKYSCAEVPQVTYGALIEYYMYNGNIEEALYYADRLQPMIKGKKPFIREMSFLISLYSITDPGEALNLFSECIMIIESIYNPNYRFEFFNSCSRLFSSIKSDGQIHLDIPDSFEIYKASGEYEISELAEYFRRESLRLAELFDKRNMSSYYKDMCDREIPSESKNDFHFPPHLKISKTGSFMSAVLEKESDSVGFEEIKSRINSAENIAINKCAEENDNKFFFSLKYENELYDVCFVLNAAKFDESIYVRHVLSDEEKCGAALSEKELVIIMNFNSDVKKSYQMQLRLLCLFSDISAVIRDYSRSMILSFRWAKLASVQSAPVNADHLFGLEFFADRGSDTICISTSGLECLGLRELELPDIPQQMCDAACSFLENAVHKLIYSALQCDEYEKLTITYTYDGRPVNCTWVTPENAMDLFSEQTGELLKAQTEEGYKTACFMFYPHMSDYKKKKPVSLSELFETHAGKIVYGKSSRELEEMSELAKSRYEYLKKGFEMSGDAIARAEVDLSEELADEYGYSTDLLWMSVKSVTDSEVTGILLESSEAAQELKKDSQITAAADKTADFRIKLGDLVITPDDVYLLDTAGNKDFKGE